MSHFDAAFGIVVGIEAGYVNDPVDPGGETKYGISKRAHPNLEIKTLTLDQAKGIYFEEYWTPLGCEVLDWAYALQLLDCGVNQGQPTALKIKKMAVDLDDFVAERILRYAMNANWEKYGLGWMRRVAKITRLGGKEP